MASTYKSLAWQDGRLRLLDQRGLPLKLDYLDISDYDGVATAIRDMAVRGAPAIGAAAAFGLALAAYHSSAKTVDGMKADLERAANVLRASRPTAVNLFWAIDRVMDRVHDEPISSIEDLRRVTLDEANVIADEDVQTNKAIGMNAMNLIPQDKVTFIHHCNTGALATIDYGTALGIIRIADEEGKDVFVYVDETRPRLQGARLTSWELKQLGIKHKVIVDGASGYVMSKHKVDLVTVGCDRVAANGDTANKIGTYNLAIVAQAHGVPFYVAAPTSTIDLNVASGDEIEIEERSAIEITNVRSEQITPDDIEVENPAFDVTPSEYITAIITEVGIAYPPYTESLPKMVEKAKQLRNQK
jgi:methylthioribose-1-phosphate isomerase